MIIRDRRIAEDGWTKLDDDAALPPTGPVIVSLARWEKDRVTLKARGSVGVSIPSNADPAVLRDDLPRLGLVQLTFAFIQPKPEGGRTYDGRAYSQARQLREQLGFKGEIRATGDVFRDAMFYMHRCGVNAFEPKTGQDLQDALGAFGDFSTHYQGAADDPVPVFRRRIA